MKEVKEAKPFSQKIADHIDNIVSVFSPSAGLRRKINRYALNNMRAAGRAYRSSETTRINDNWIPTGGSPDEDLLRELPALREKSRDLIRNNAYAAGVCATIVTNVVGTGIRPQSSIDKNAVGLKEGDVEKFQNSVESSWHRWVEYADVTGHLDFYGIQDLVERQILENGEVFLIPLMIKTVESPYMLRLQVVEADRVSTPAELKGNKNVRDGIELDNTGRPIAYYVRKTHPGDRMYRKDFGNSSENFIRYPARNEMGRPNIFHLYYMKRPGQTRGIPFLSPVINYFKDLEDYMEAELMSAKVSACYSVFVKKNNPAGAAMGAAARTDGTKRIESLEPGIIEYLNYDEDVTFANPQRPGGNFSPFVEQNLRMIAAGLNLPFEVFVRDFTRSSYSSARAALQEARRYFKERQKFLERELCQPVWEMVLEEAYLNGETPNVAFYQNRLALQKVSWISPGWGWIDPTKEVDAARSAIEGHLSTLAEEAAAMGKDWKAILEQEAREKAEKERLGLVDVSTTKKKLLIDQNAQEQEDPKKDPAAARAK